MEAGYSVLNVAYAALNYLNVSVCCIFVCYSIEITKHIVFFSRVLSPFAFCRDTWLILERHGLC